MVSDFLQVFTASMQLKIDSKKKKHTIVFKYVQTIGTVLPYFFALDLEPWNGFEVACSLQKELNFLNDHGISQEAEMILKIITFSDVRNIFSWNWPAMLLKERYAMINVTPRLLRTFLLYE